MHHGLAAHGHPSTLTCPLSGSSWLPQASLPRTQSPAPEHITSQGFQGTGSPGPGKTGGVGTLPQDCNALTDMPGVKQREFSILLGVQPVTFAAFVPQAKGGVGTRHSH